jgi:allantoin racemase
VTKKAQCQCSARLVEVQGELDKAEAVVIGGGPLGNAATALTPMFAVPVIAAIPAAVRQMLRILGPFS